MIMQQTEMDGKITSHSVFVMVLHTCEVTLDISGSPINFQWDPRNIQGNFTGMVLNPGSQDLEESSTLLHCCYN